MAPTNNQPRFEQIPRPAVQPNMMPQQPGNFVVPNYNAQANNFNVDPARARAEQIA